MVGGTSYPTIYINEYASLSSSSNLSCSLKSGAGWKDRDLCIRHKIGIRHFLTFFFYQKTLLLKKKDVQNLLIFSSAKENTTNPNENATKMQLCRNESPERFEKRLHSLRVINIPSSKDMNVLTQVLVHIRLIKWLFSYRIVK